MSRDRIKHETHRTGRLFFTPSPFWKSAAVLLNCRSQLGLALAGAIISASCFGAGLSMMLPAMQLLLGQQKSLMQVISEHLLQPGIPQFAQQVARWMAAHVPTDPFWSFVIVMVAIGLLAAVSSMARYLHELSALMVVSRATMVWRDRLFARLLEVPMAQVLRFGTADSISRLISDTRVLFAGYEAILGTPALELLKGVAGLTVAIALNFRLSLIALIGGPLILLVMRKFGAAIRASSQQALEQYGRMIGSVQQSLLAIGVVKVHNAEEYERRRFELADRALLAQERSIGQTRAVASALIDALSMLLVVVLATVAAWFIFRRSIDAASFITVMVALTAAAQSLRPLARLSQGLAEADAAATRLLEVITSPAELTGVEVSSVAPVLPRHRRDIVFEFVSFSYPGRNREALRGATLKVSHGQAVIIIGPNGSGKTTLVSLLPRLFEPASGRILIDGIDIAGVSLTSLRKQIALVSQETALLQGTVAENIAYGLSDISIERIAAAARAAYADEFIVRLPEGYRTELGEFGTGLSAGQKQRLAIARAILRDPAIWILDEATSQVDPDSESKIRNVLHNLRRDRTIFIITHHLKALVDADLIVVMDNGQIVDTGTHDQLLNRCATYQRLNDAELFREAVGGG